MCVCRLMNCGHIITFRPLRGKGGVCVLLPPSPLRHGSLVSFLLKMGLCVSTTQWQIIGFDKTEALPDLKLTLHDSVIIFASHITWQIKSKRQLLHVKKSQFFKLLLFFLGFLHGCSMYIIMNADSYIFKLTAFVILLFSPIPFI